MPNYQLPCKTLDIKNIATNVIKFERNAIGAEGVVSSGAVMAAARVYYYLVPEKAS